MPTETKELKTWEITLQLSIGKLVIDDIQAETEDEAIRKAMRIADDELWACKISQIECK